jgi:hypothetical protein
MHHNAAGKCITRVLKDQGDRQICIEMCRIYSKRNINVFFSMRTQYKTLWVWQYQETDIRYYTLNLALNIIMLLWGFFHYKQKQLPNEVYFYIPK